MDYTKIIIQTKKMNKKSKKINNYQINSDVKSKNNQSIIKKIILKNIDYIKEYQIQSNKKNTKKFNYSSIKKILQNFFLMKKLFQKKIKFFSKINQKKNIFRNCKIHFLNSPLIKKFIFSKIG